MDTSRPIYLQSIGVVHSPFHELENMPIQPTGKHAREGWVELFPEFQEGLKDLEDFSHLILIYYFHRAAAVKLTVTPFLDRREHGIFATRAPLRPNPIGLSVVPVDRIEGSAIYLRQLDVLDGTPLLDLKPFVPAFDVPSCPVRTGWLAETAERAVATLSDERFK